MAARNRPSPSAGTAALDAGLTRSQSAAVRPFYSTARVNRQMTRLTKCLVDTANQASTTLTDAQLAFDDTSSYWHSLG